MGGFKGENIEEVYEKGKGEVVWRCRVDETRHNHPPFPELDSFVHFRSSSRHF